MRLVESNPPVSDRRSVHRVAARARLHRDEARAVLAELTDERIDMLVRRGLLVSAPDGFPGSTMSDGLPHGGSVLTSVEAAAYRLIGNSDTVVGGGDRDDDLRPEPDSVGVLISGLLDSLRQMNNLAARVDRDLVKVLHTRERTEIRKAEPGGKCGCCFEDVTGTEWDRLRNLFCNRCYCAWRTWSKAETAAGRDPKRRDAVSEDQVFVVWMRARLVFEAESALAGSGSTEPLSAAALRPLQVITGGFVHGVGEVTSGVV